MIIRIALPFRFMKEDLEIFCEYRMETEHPLKTIAGERKEDITKDNHIFSRLIRLRFPDNKERSMAEEILRKAWRQYINLYYEGICRRFMELTFDIRIFDERTKHGYSEKAVYFVFRPKAKRRVDNSDADTAKSEIWFSHNDSKNRREKKRIRSLEVPM